MAPKDHPLRVALTNELHARPFAELRIPERIAHLAMVSSDSSDAERSHLSALCALYDLAEVPEHATHFMGDFGSFRLKWERHTEFTTYTFMRSGPFDEPFAEPVTARAPQAWLDAIPGERITAAQVVLTAADGSTLSMDDVSHSFVAHSLCRSRMLDGMADVWTDFRIHADGFGRILVQDRGLAPRQVGRLVQRLLEMQTYRNMALLALPLAREANPALVRADQALARLTAQMTRLKSTGDDRLLLDELMTVSAEIEESIAATSYRFSAARAYYALVGERIAETREQAVQGYSRLGEFMARRLAPAMRTCESVADRQDILSQRATRAANLLRTRVDIALEQQNRDLLASMDRRARLQLRLQQTVEGLSVAAISYYVISLVGYVLEATEHSPYPLDARLWRGISIPIVVALVWLGVRTVRKSLHRRET